MKKVRSDKLSIQTARRRRKKKSQILKVLENESRTGSLTKFNIEDVYINTVTRRKFPKADKLSI